MRQLLLYLAFISVLAMISWSLGCGGGGDTATPQQMEEHRQKQIQHADRERREG